MMKISLDFCRHKMVVHPYYKKEKKKTQKPGLKREPTTQNHPIQLQNNT